MSHALPSNGSVGEQDWTLTGARAVEGDEDPTEVSALWRIRAVPLRLPAIWGVARCATSR